MAWGRDEERRENVEEGEEEIDETVSPRTSSTGQYDNMG